MMEDFFSLLGVPRGFAVDSATLEAAYFARQRECHPDRFATDATARAQTMQRSVAVNDAYRTLKDPLARARYLLGAEAHPEPKPDEALLSEVMLQREALEEAESLASLQRLSAEADEAEARCIAGLAEVFAQNDHHAATQLTLRLGYLHRLKEAIRVKTLAAAHP